MLNLPGNWQFQSVVISILNDLLLGQEVLLKLGDRPEVAEVTFSQSYSEAVRKLHGLNIGSHKNTPSKNNKPGRSNMKALASVAAAGVATVSISGVAEKLLSQPDLPSVPSPRTWGSLPAKMEWTFQKENCEVMILFDLLCIGCRTWEMCNNMIDSINVQLKGKAGSSRSTVGRTDVGGKEHGEDGKRLRQKELGDMVLLFERILQLGTGVDNMSPSMGQQEISTALYKHSIQTFLQTATLPLSPDHCKLYAQLTSNVKNCLGNVETAFTLAERSPTDGSPSKKRRGSASSVSSQASPRRQEPVSPEPQAIHGAMKQLIQVLDKALPLGGLCQLFNKEKGTDPRKNRDYLLHLYEHLKRLAFVVAENEATSKDTMVMPTNYFKMLDQGPIYTLGRLVFSKRIPPSRYGISISFPILDLSEEILFLYMSESRRRRVNQSTGGQVARYPQSKPSHTSLIHESDLSPVFPTIIYGWICLQLYTGTGDQQSRAVNHNYPDEHIAVDEDTKKRLPQQQNTEEVVTGDNPYSVSIGL
ncbi:zinc finger FYVE domain-containing protein 26-like [Argopecten irradians]|uniref:zinc finger FYVE domain-containing protein 26-like n=1 Tax=Argopecten irradians TaxID=31199 RepID=UPI003721A313